MPDDYDDDLDDDLDDDDNTPLVRKLRAENKRLAKEAKEAKDLRAEIARRDREKVVAEAGLTLKPAQVTALLAAHGDKELTPDLIYATAVDLDWAQPKEADVPSDDLDTHDRVAAASGGADLPSRNTGVVTPQDVAEWSTEKIQRFLRTHPDEFEALKRGEPVRVANF